MTRRKKYSESEVIDIATNVFWENGLEATSMQTLEREMGINKFSIYSSFGNKDGVYIECLKNYAKRIVSIQRKLKDSGNGLLGIKQYFYDFIEFSREFDSQKGCMITNTFGELNDTVNPDIRKELQTFVERMKSLIAANVAQESGDVDSNIAQVDYLMVALHGLAAASKVFEREQLDNYIENIFREI